MIHEQTLPAAARPTVRYASRRYPKIDRASALWSMQAVAQGKTPTLRHILLEVERVTNIHLYDLLSPCRARPVVRARQMYYWLATRVTRQPYTMISRICGRKDHSTVIHGIKKVDRLRETFEPELSLLLDALTPRGEGPQ